MTNEEKARHLASRDMYGGFTLAEQNAAYCASMAMAEWKDEQFAKEKQQWIEKACDTIKHLLDGYVIRNFNFGDSYDMDELIDDFKKAMKGE